AAPSATTAERAERKLRRPPRAGAGAHCFAAHASFSAHTSFRSPYVSSSKRVRMSGLLDGKRLVITGVISESSIAMAVARLAQEQGAEIVLTAYGRPTLVRRLARRLPVEPPVVDLDVTDPGHLATLADRLSAHVDGLDGVLHSVAYAP